MHVVCCLPASPPACPSSYLETILEQLGSWTVMVPPLPPLTRYKREVAIKQVGSRMPHGCCSVERLRIAARAAPCSQTRCRIIRPAAADQPHSTHLRPAACIIPACHCSWQEEAESGMPGLPLALPPPGFTSKKGATFLQSVPRTEQE